jgi:hypothetical protein
MKTSLLLPTLSVTLGFALACSGGSAPEAAPTAPPAAATHIGVPECDEYVRKMEACLGSMDPAMKSQFEAAYNATHAAWILTASSPTGAESLKPGCIAALANLPPTCPGAAPAALPAPAIQGVEAPAAADAPAPAEAPSVAPIAPRRPLRNRQPSLKDMRRPNH